MRKAWSTPRARRTLLPLLPMLLAAVALWPVARPVEGVGDAFMFWFAGHQVASGRSPYDQAAWVAAGPMYGLPATNVAQNCAEAASTLCTWVYPPAAGWLFAPFGAADVSSGIIGVEVFVVLTAFAGVITSVLVFGPATAGARAVVLATAVASHPFVYDIHVGHFAGLELLGIVGIVVALRRRAAAPLVLGVLALSLKPHLFLVLAPLVLCVLVARGLWRAIACVMATLFVLLAAAAILQPEAFSALLGRAGGKGDLTWSTSWALAQVILPPAPLVALGGLVGTAVVAAVVAVRATPRSDRDLSLVAVGTALSLAVTPYDQPYDLLLLVPLIAFAARAVARAPRRAWPPMFAALPVVFVAGTWLPVIAAQVWDHANRSVALVPVLALVLAAATLAAGRSHLLFAATPTAPALRDVARR